MKKDFMTKFNFATNIFILSILIFGGAIWADSNGIWTYAEDIRSGVFGGDEGAGDFTFNSTVNFNGSVNLNSISCPSNMKLYTNAQGQLVCGTDLDNQILSYDSTSNNLSISNGNSVNLENIISSNPNLSEVLSNGNSAKNLRITNLGNPLLAQDAATKSYVDTFDPSISNELPLSGYGILTNQRIVSVDTNEITTLLALYNAFVEYGLISNNVARGSHSDSGSNTWISWSPDTTIKPSFSQVFRTWTGDLGGSGVSAGIGCREDLGYTIVPNTCIYSGVNLVWDDCAYYNSGGDCVGGWISGSVPGIIKTINGFEYCTYTQDKPGTQTATVTCEKGAETFSNFKSKILN